MPKSTIQTTPMKTTPAQTTRVQTTRVLIIDDHAVVRAGLRLLVESDPGTMVVGEACNREESLTLAAGEQPDVILLDLQLGQDNGLDFLPDLLATADGARVIVLTAETDSQIHRSVMSLGAMGIVLKEHASEALLKAVARVRDGEIWIDPSMLANVLLGPPQKEEEVDSEMEKIITLTPREREVIALVGEGLKNKQVAARLYISETTVRHHLTSIFNKLDVADRLELVIYAYRHGLVKPIPPGSTDGDAV
jgi:DNA-binding NarL/FixJ family response regulator